MKTNPAAELAKHRWANVTPRDKRRIIRDLTNAAARARTLAAQAKKDRAKEST